MKVLLPLIISLCLIGSALGFGYISLTKSKLEMIQRSLDYKHNFVLFNQTVMDSLAEFFQLHKANKPNQDVYVYHNDCNQNQLPQCKVSQHVPIVLIFNRVITQFSGDPNNMNQIEQWVQSRLYHHSKHIHHYHELEDYLKTTKNVFCYVRNVKNGDEQALFSTLGKSMPYQQFCIITNPVLAQNISLKQSNLTLFLDSITNRKQYQHPNRLDSWEQFVKFYFLPDYQRAKKIASNRFTFEEKNITAVSFVCDFSQKCEKYWLQFAKNPQKYTKQNLGFDFYLAIQDQKESFALNLFYNLGFYKHKLPALLVIKLSNNDTQTSGYIEKFIQYIPEEQFGEELLKKFLDRVNKEEVQPFYMSEVLPKKNGFYGKGSEKLVQKLVARNVIQEVQASKNHYFLLVTAFGIDCKQCNQFYPQFKQIASFFKQQPFTFGLLDITKNEIPFEKIHTIPQILIFKRDDKQNPYYFDGRHSFDDLLKLIKKDFADELNDEEL